MVMAYLLQMEIRILKPLHFCRLIMQEELGNFLPELMKISGFKHPIRD